MILLTFAWVAAACFGQPEPVVACNKLKSFPFCNTGLELEARVSDLIRRIQDEDKANLLTARGIGGILKDLPELGVPGYYWGTNCLHALNQVSVLPVVITYSSSGTMRGDSRNKYNVLSDQLSIWTKHCGNI